MSKEKVSTYDHFHVLATQHYPMRLAAVLIFFVHGYRFLLRKLIGRRRRDKYFIRKHKAFKENVGWYDFAFLMRIPFSNAMIRQWVNHEPEVSALIKTLSGDLYVDIGCNTCYFPLLVQKNFKQIIGFEADPEIALWAHKNIKIPHMFIHNLAVSDSSEGVFLHRNPTSLYGGASIVANFRWQGFAVKSISLNEFFNNSITLNEYFNNFNIRNKQIDLVKMDIEGAEWLALKGAEKVMHRIKAWIIELHDPPRKGELERYMQGFGYKTEWIDDYNLHDGQVIWNPHLYAWRP